MLILLLLDYGFCSPVLKSGRAKNKKYKKKELSNICNTTGSAVTCTFKVKP
jgi:hypothetical protein